MLARRREAALVVRHGTSRAALLAGAAAAERECIALNVRITQHQNGFLKVSLPLGGRLHVWSPWNPPAQTDQAEHDHPFGFMSRCVAGEMINVELEAAPCRDGEWEELAAECVSSFQEQPLPSATGLRFSLSPTRTTIVRRGESYEMRPGVIHRTDAVFAMTIFKKTQTVPGHARVFARTAAQSSQRFVVPHESLLRISLDAALRAAHLTLDDIFAIEAAEHATVSQIALRSLEKLTAPGYHERAVPRSPHGTAGKVVEEALELLDAQAQGARLMAAQECADVLSAVRGFVESELAGITMSDVELMAAITDRAFASGVRRAR